jgi:hypothetical protein
VLSSLFVATIALLPVAKLSPCQYFVGANVFVGKCQSMRQLGRMREEAQLSN